MNAIDTEESFYFSPYPNVQAEDDVLADDEWKRSIFFYYFASKGFQNFIFNSLKTR